MKNSIFMFIYEPQFIADSAVNKIRHRKAREEREGSYDTLTKLGS
ncbi:MAG: hypothetical protein O8C64_13095 [Candidatus Methanoperedens sp.]|nr:hypothetical protein [Candidatus Methanoperedens sp.]MCZ7403854.1 hypothetical protein [Candidatus Methanoperedens sp.]